MIKRVSDLQQITCDHLPCRFTAKMFGYKDVMEYYADARLYDKVENIKVCIRVDHGCLSEC